MGLELPDNKWSSWILKIFDHDVRDRAERSARSGRRVSESELEALCLKNGAHCLRNIFSHSGRDARFCGYDLVFGGENWLDKIGWISKDRSRLLPDLLLKPSPN